MLGGGGGGGLLWGFFRAKCSRRGCESCFVEVVVERGFIRGYWGYTFVETAVVVVEWLMLGVVVVVGVVEAMVVIIVVVVWLIEAGVTTRGFWC